MEVAEPLLDPVVVRMRAAVPCDRDAVGLAVLAVSSQGILQPLVTVERIRVLPIQPAGEPADGAGHADQSDGRSAAPFAAHT